MEVVDSQGELVVIATLRPSKEQEAAENESLLQKLYRGDAVENPCIVRGED